ncbi:MAG: hypothetical protein EOP77_00625 [Variovorax sp.]|nr:MAG: hypothetical protein EOP77_00625 [Variovorax sp.]
MTIVILCLAAFAAGCTTKTPYRVSGRVCDVPEAVQDAKGRYQWEAAGKDGDSCGEAWQVNVAKPTPFSMNFVEFDDQGVFASRRQAEAALANAARSEPDGAYVVVFVHGWHHQAKSGDGNVQGFYDTLASVSRWNPKRKIKGIYIGWRGDSIDVPYLDNLTFWDRKGTSDEVGRGAFLEFLLRLEREVKSNPADNNKLVLIGHSFGASVSFNALAHVMLTRFLDGAYATQARPRFQGYGDLVVLVNPAIEAMRFMPLQSALEHYTRKGARPQVDFAHENRPALVILSSVADFPTRRLFPAGRALTTSFEAHTRVSDMSSPDPQGRYSEWTMDINTVGNYLNFQTHATIELDMTSSEESPISEKDLSAGLKNSCRAVAPDELRRLLNVRQGQADNSSFPDSRVRIRRLPREGMDYSPYIVAAVDSKVVDGHNDIGGLNLVCWINQMLDTRESSPAAPVAKRPNQSPDYKVK